MRWRHAVSACRPAADEDTEDSIWGDGGGMPVVGDELFTDGEAEISRQVLNSEIQRAILTLPESHRQMIFLWSQGWTFDELGHLCGMSAAWAHSIVNASLANLREKLN